jgi:hypothetical protein
MKVHVQISNFIRSTMMAAGLAQQGVLAVAVSLSSHSTRLRPSRHGLLDRKAAAPAAVAVQAAVVPQ